MQLKIAPERSESPEIDYEEEEEIQRDLEERKVNAAESELD